MFHRFVRALLAFVVATSVIVGGSTAWAAGETPDIDAARAGLAAYLDANRPETPQTSTDIPGCPAITLDRLQQALGDAGIDDGIEDWGTEIEWREYQHIDADLMGITCGGDADGDSHDGDFEMLASVYAVDAGNDERAQEILDELGFGALEIESADVPGGELANVCVDDPEQSLSMCMSFWSGDGFVLGVVLASDVTDIPDGASSAVLVDTFDDIIATLGEVTAVPPATTEVPTASAAPVPSTEDGSLDVAGARAGLAALVDNAPDTGPNEPLAECPVVDHSAVNSALEAAGVDAPLAEWNVEVGPVDTGPTWNDRGLTCVGAYVGSDQDESFPELRVSLIVVDLDKSDAFEQFLADAYPGATDPLPTPALGGATRGECVHIDLTDHCIEFWEQDGFVVGIVLADRVFMDRPTASAVLNELVPAVVASLIATPAAEEPAQFEASAEQVAAARSGLLVLSQSGGEAGELGDCPLVDRATVNDTLAATGVDVAVEKWSGHVNMGLGVDSTIRPLGVSCEDLEFTEGVAIHVSDYGDSASAQEVIDLVIGCERAGEFSFCVESWQQDGLAVTLTVTAPRAGRDAIAEVLEAVVPIVLDNLAAVS